MTFLNQILDFLQSSNLQPWHFLALFIVFTMIALFSLRHFLYLFLKLNKLSSQIEKNQKLLLEIQQKLQVDIDIKDSTIDDLSDSQNRTSVSNTKKDNLIFH